MLKLDYDGIHRFVEGYANASWDGWTVEIFKPTPAGFSHKRGAFRNGTWGLVTRISPDSQGKWKLRV